MKILDKNIDEYFCDHGVGNVFFEWRNVTKYPRKVNELNIIKIKYYLQRYH